MFEKIGRLAETAANKVSLSRRGFLGRLGQRALAMTGVLGGLLAIRTAARAGGSYICCTWLIKYGPGKGYKVSQCYPPPRTFCYGPHPQQRSVSSCAQCT
jgi:hypothetical protein